MRVLVVDDEADTRDLVREVLGRCGAEVVTAADVREALEALQQERFDALVDDVVMPGQDGHELIRAVRALPPDRGGSAGSPGAGPAGRNPQIVRWRRVNSPSRSKSSAVRFTK
ncbi:MAG TPA: response regulator [Candidatus Binatia bacterium]|nr:response regulator [Candidatus Binatia bacterium]